MIIAAVTNHTMLEVLPFWLLIAAVDLSVGYFFYTTAMSADAKEKERVNG